MEQVAQTLHHIDILQTINIGLLVAQIIGIIIIYRMNRKLREVLKK